MKKLMTLLMAALLVLGLGACGDSGSQDDFKDSVKTLIQGELDTMYLGQYNQDYMDLVGATEDDCRSNYESGLETEAKYFCNYLNITDSENGETWEDNVSDELKQQIIDMYKEIYSHSSYTVGEVSELENGDYTVQVTVNPINVFELAIDAVSNGEDNAYTRFTAAYADRDFSSMTDEEYAQYSEDYGQACVDLIKEYLPKLGYDDAKTIMVQVQKQSDGYYYSNSDDLSNVDAAIIMYP